VPLSCNLGTLTSRNSLDHSRPVTGMLYLYQPYACYMFPPSSSPLFDLPENICRRTKYEVPRYTIFSVILSLPLYLVELFSSVPLFLKRNKGHSVHITKLSYFHHVLAAGDSRSSPTDRLVVSQPLWQPEVTSRSRDVNKHGGGVNDLPTPTPN